MINQVINQARQNTLSLPYMQQGMSFSLSVLHFSDNKKQNQKCKKNAILRMSLILRTLWTTILN